VFSPPQINHTFFTKQCKHLLILSVFGTISQFLTSKRISLGLLSGLIPGPSASEGLPSEIGRKIATTKTDCPLLGIEQVTNRFNTHHRTHRTIEAGMMIVSILLFYTSKTYFCPSTKNNQQATKLCVVI
jgi:hypothetical protein